MRMSEFSTWVTMHEHTADPTACPRHTGDGYAADEANSAPIGGSRAATATSDRHAARLICQSAPRLQTRLQHRVEQAAGRDRGVRGCPGVHHLTNQDFQGGFTGAEPFVVRQVRMQVEVGDIGQQALLVLAGQVERSGVAVLGGCRSQAKAVADRRAECRHQRDSEAACPLLSRQGDVAVVRKLGALPLQGHVLWQVAGVADVVVRADEQHGFRPGQEAAQRPRFPRG